MSEHYDVIIIGTGAGGGTLAHRLAPTGKRILLLERGGYVPREPENWESEQVFLKERYLSGEEWIDKDGTAFRPHQQYFVGGNTKFYGAILPLPRARLRRGPPLGGHVARVADRLSRPEALIDLLHHTVYAVATGLAYELVAAGRRSATR